MGEQDDAIVDVTLIDEMLAMTVEERLRLNDRMVSTVLALRLALDQPRRSDGSGD